MNINFEKQNMLDRVVLEDEKLYMRVKFLPNYTAVGARSVVSAIVVFLVVLLNLITIKRFDDITFIAGCIVYLFLFCFWNAGVLKTKILYVDKIHAFAYFSIVFGERGISMKNFSTGLRNDGMIAKLVDVTPSGRYKNINASFLRLIVEFKRSDGTVLKETFLTARSTKDQQKLKEIGEKIIELTASLQ